MEGQTPKDVNKSTKDVRSGSDVYQRSSSDAYQCSGSDIFQRSRNSGLSFRRNSTRRASTANDVENLHETPKRVKYDDSFNGSWNSTNAETAPPSPWELTRMRGDIIALRTKVSHQEETIDQLHKVRREMDEVFHKEKKILEIEIEEGKRTIKQLQLRVDQGRQTVQEAKNARAQAEKELIQMRSKMEQKILALVDDNNKLTGELRHFMKQETEPKMDILKSADNKSPELQEKLDECNKRIPELEEKLKEARALMRSTQQKFELQTIEFQSLRIKCESLEAEKYMWEQGKDHMSRASRVNGLEKELEHAKDIISSLRESVRGKLLLEEQLATMEQRLQYIEKLEQQVSKLEVSQGDLLAKIAEYEAIGIVGGPVAVKRELHRLQQAEMFLTAEEGQLRSKVDSVQRELENTKQKLTETNKALADTTNSHERLARFVTRLQKKLSLVTRERDSYKQQLECYEKEMAGTQSETSNIANERIPALERAIDGYRELVAKLESDLESVDGINQKEECKKLREEIDKLKGEIEHRALKGDFNINTRILHFKMNPAAIAEQQAEEKQKALLQEVEQLRVIVASGNHSEVPATSSLQAQEIAELQQKHEIKISRLKEAFKASSHEYRQACYQLFGWRVDRTKEGQYKLSSQYAESPDDYLFFLVKEDGVNMVETPFSSTLTTFIERHLQQQHSVPMFLNAVQCDLFDQQTITNIVAT